VEFEAMNGFLSLFGGRGLDDFKSMHVPAVLREASATAEHRIADGISTWPRVRPSRG
jgi:hypothetical protein